MAVMAIDRPDGDPAGTDAGRFPTTRWSRVAAAGDPASPGGRAALEGLCRDYWYPLYALVRRKGYGPDEAADLVQGFLADLLERGDLAAADRARGRFRSFLLGRLLPLPGEPPRPRPGVEARRRPRARSRSTPRGPRAVIGPSPPTR